MFTYEKKNNFDLIRLILALLVLLLHTGKISKNKELVSLGSFFDGISVFAVDSFFVLSGFLIFMSYERSRSIKEYFVKRLRRIYPGYIFVVLVSSIGLFFLSADSAKDYFSVEWIKYIFYNSIFLNFLHNYLPGVFENNGIKVINGALWSIKIEVMFYMSVPLLAYFFSKGTRIKRLLLVYIFSISYFYICQYMAYFYDNNIFLVLGRQLPGQLSFFISGTLLYYYYDEIKKRKHFVLFFGVMLFIFSQKFDLYFFYPLSLAILIIYFANFLFFLGHWGKYGDFSYGIYIWHFPILQIFVSLRLFEKTPYISYIVFLFTVFVASYLSWTFIEKPFLQKKSHYRLEENMIPD